MKRPDLAPKGMELDLAYVDGLLGEKLEAAEVKRLLEKMRYGAEIKGGKIMVSIPPYRADIMHPIDLVEDIAIAYGYMGFKPQVPKLYSLGKADALELSVEDVRDCLIGMQFTEVMNLILTNNRDLYDRMNAPRGRPVEALKPVSAEQGVARTWILPSLMVVLERNKNREYPQRIFEAGEALDPEGRTEMRVAGAIAHARTNFSEIKAAVAGLLVNLKLDSKDEPYDHPSFIKGRSAKNKHGFFGEVAPEVLSNFGLEVPVTVFELKLN